MAALDAALPEAVRAGHAADAGALGDLVAASVRAGDVVLVKGSAGAKMGKVVAALDALNQAGGSQEGSHAS
jgi:UDP-N-acetylmuramoyl-tripeptide--D-alanyl-D-alanine ligase